MQKLMIKCNNNELQISSKMMRFASIFYVSGIGAKTGLIIFYLLNTTILNKKL